MDMNRNFSKLIVLMIIILFFATNLITITSANPISNDTRGSRALSFTEISSGLPAAGEYNFIAFGDINDDNEIDIAFGGEDYQGSTVGLYVYTGDGGTSWTDASSGLPTDNAWGGVQLVDADGDGFIELYASDEKWGADSNSGLKVWEYRSGSWTDSASHISTPYSTGRPDNVLLEDITGDNKLDLVLCTQSGINYYENTGGNPVTWSERSTGLADSSEYTAVTVADMNKDGLKDIVASDYSGGKHLFIQQASGDLWAEHSTDLTVSGTVLGLAVGDVNEDTHNDIIFGTRDNGLKCLLGDSGGADSTTFTWTEASTNLPTSSRYCQIQLIDIDIDNDLDLIAPAATNNKGIEIYLGNGNNNPGINMDWTLASNTNLAATGNWYGSNYYDIDKDGYSDIVAASWGSGIKAYLSDLSGNVDQTAPGAVSDLKVTNTTTSSIIINWSAPADNGTEPTSGVVQSYDLRYSTENIDISNWDSATECTGEPTPAAPGTGQGFKVNSLLEGTTYYFAIRSVDERPNLSPLSNVITQTTLIELDSTPPATISDLKVNNPTEISLTLSWTATGDDGGSGNAGVYDIRYSNIEITDSNWDNSILVQNLPTPKNVGDTEELVVADLYPNTTYHFALKVGDEIPNWSPISNSVSGTTLSPSLPGMKASLILDDSSITSGGITSLEVTVLAQDDSSPIQAANVVFSADNEELILTPESGKTDTNGKLSVSIQGQEVTSITEIIITAKITKTDFIDLSQQIKITIVPKQVPELAFNLQITNFDISFSKSEITEGDLVTINANVTNAGPGEATAFTIRISIDGIQLGNEQQYSSLAIGNIQSIDKKWTAKAGEHIISIEINPIDFDKEMDPTDNLRENTITVNEKDDGITEDPDEKNDNKGDQAIVWIGLIVIIIVIILIILFFLLKRKRNVPMQK
jgi:hypothetical protein